MVVVWGNILSLWGNVFAIAVDILVFDAFFPHNDNRKKRWSYILLFCLIFTSLSILIGTKLGYTFKMLQEIVLIYVLCVFLYQSRWDRRFFIVVTVYSVLFSYSHWFESFLPICWKFGLRRIYMECSSMLRAILRSRVYFPICCTDY